MIDVAEVQDAYQERLLAGETPEEIAHTIAASKAAEMRRKLKGSHPRLMGWPGLTPEELIESEYDCWYDEELGIILRALDNGDLSRRPGRVIDMLQPRLI